MQQESMHQEYSNPFKPPMQQMREKQAFNLDRLFLKFKSSGQ
jgi:hypothetical protein